MENTEQDIIVQQLVDEYTELIKELIKYGENHDSINKMLINFIKSYRNNLVKKDRYFVDERVGCIAIRDTMHPEYDETYPGLHDYTVDVIEFRMGDMDDKYNWQISDIDRNILTYKCEKMNNENQYINT